jgi:hypothetical protein
MHSGDHNMMGSDTMAPVFAGADGAAAPPSAVTITWKAASDDKSASDKIVYLI